MKHRGVLIIHERVEGKKIKFIFYLKKKRKLPVMFGIGFIFPPKKEKNRDSLIVKMTDMAYEACFRKIDEQLDKKGAKPIKEAY